MRRAILLFLVVVIVLYFPSSTFAQSRADHDTGYWRLPIQGTQYISNGPGEGLHINASSEAIDYAGSFSVYAPTDGYILDVLKVTDFGWVVRITHGNAYNQNAVISFYAHMNGNSVSHWQPGNPVAAGALIGTSSNSGTGGAAGSHLHFEARVNATLGNVYSGQSVPIRALPGQWWYQWYSPTPDFRYDVNQHSGVAQYPLVRNPPGNLTNMRHLANFESPPSIPSVYLSNVTNTSVVFHMGGSPSTPIPNNNQYRTDFQLQYYSLSKGRWIADYGSYTGSPSYSHLLNTDNRCTTQNQRCHQIFSRNTLRGWSSFRKMNFHTGNSNTRQPYLIFSHQPGSDIAVLHYDSTNATHFSVWEDPVDGPQVGIYYGTAKTLRVRYRAGTTYIVSAWSPSQGWSPWSIWVITSI